MTKKIQPILFFGYPGSGKTLQAKIISDRFNFPYLSTGKLIKDYISKKRINYKQIEIKYKKGIPQSNQLIFELIKESFLNLDLKSSEALILDNFPFNNNQFKWWQSYLNKKGLEPTLGFYLDISQKTVIKRLGERGREDDKEQVINKRIDKYSKSIKFLRDRFETDNRLIIIDGEPAIEKVTNSIIAKLNERNII
jgi:adenylate kinase